MLRISPKVWPLVAGLSPVLVVAMLVGCAASTQNDRPVVGDPTGGSGDALAGDTGGDPLAGDADAPGDVVSGAGDPLVGDAPGDADGLAWPSGKYMSPTEVHTHLVANDPEMLPLNVVDVEHYNLGHIEGSLKIPWDQLASRLNEVDIGKHVLVYCRRGVRSESGYDTLIANSYPRVWVMEGGIEAWLALEYPVVP